MTGEDLLAFEARMKEARKLRRGALCAALGVSQAKWRRLVERPGERVVDRTIELAVLAFEHLADRVAELE